MSAKHIPGKFVWFEIKTHDGGAAEAFYSALFGWGTLVMPMPDGGSYTMFAEGDDAFAGIAPYDGGDAPQGDRPGWYSWISVDDVDAACERIVEHGGEVSAGPTDMGDMMRMAFCVDPEGVTFGIMRSTAGDPPDAPSAIGRFDWNELYADDPEAQAAFYCAVFGYELETAEMGFGPYRMLNSGGKSRGGVMGKPHPEHDAIWLPYVHVQDPDATIARAVDLGGRRDGHMMEVPGVGRFGMLRDPQGVRIAVIGPDR